MQCLDQWGSEVLAGVFLNCVPVFHGVVLSWANCLTAAALYLTFTDMRVVLIITHKNMKTNKQIFPKVSLSAVTVHESSWRWKCQIHKKSELQHLITEYLLCTPVLYSVGASKDDSFLYTVQKKRENKIWWGDSNGLVKSMHLLSKLDEHKPWTCGAFAKPAGNS